MVQAQVIQQVRDVGAVPNLAAFAIDNDSNFAEIQGSRSLVRGLMNFERADCEANLPSPAAALGPCWPGDGRRCRPSAPVRRR